MAKKVSIPKEDSKTEKMMTAKVGGAPLDIPKDFENKLITEELIQLVKPRAEVIHQLLTSQSRLEIQVGSELSALRNQFRAYAAKKKLTTEEAESALSHFIQETFNLSWARAKEYILVADKTLLRRLRLPISILVEMARLPDDSLSKLLEEYSPETLAKFTYRTVKELCQERNQNARQRLSNAEKVVSSEKFESGNSTPISGATPHSKADTSSKETLLLVEKTDREPNAVLTATEVETPENKARELSVVFEIPSVDHFEEGLDTSYSPNRTHESPAIAIARMKSAFESFKEAFKHQSLNDEALKLLREIEEWKLRKTDVANKKGGVA